MLVSVKSLIVEAANTGAFSQEEIEANQLQLDSAVDSITRISNSTSFAGLKLINGSLDYIVSGVNSSNIQDVKVFGANFGTSTSIPVNVEVLASAQQAQLFLSGNTTGTFTSSVTFEVTGPKGVEVFSFVSGTALSAVAFSLNQTSDATGVRASLASATDQTSGLILRSAAYGTDSFVSVRKLQDGDFFRTFESNGGAQKQRDTGQDVLALVNGSLAIGDGTEVTVRSSTVNMSLNLTTTAATASIPPTTHTFSITGGGANFQVGGKVDSSQQIGFGIQSVAASHLGNETVGFLSSVVTGGDNSLVAGRQRQASDIVDASIDQIAVLRGRLGAFERNTLDTTLRSQQVALENLTASESDIRDADFAAETSALTRAQILVNAGTSTLGIANSSAQSVLSLLG